VNGQTLTVNLPARLTLPASVVGQTATINVSVGGDDDQGDDDHGGGPRPRTRRNRSSSPRTARS
jgi:hypothetical protein